MTSEQRQYHLEEYKTLKHELAETFKEAFQIVVFSVTANAAVFTFISSHPDVVKGGRFLFVILFTDFDNCHFVRTVFTQKAFYNTYYVIFM
jgi:hypothetical protein